VWVEFKDCGREMVPWSSGLRCLLCWGRLEKGIVSCVHRCNLSDLYAINGTYLK
jgi:hypothetical protein